MFVYVYDDGEISSDAQTGVYFASAKTIMIRIHRDFRLSKLICIIMDKQIKIQGMEFHSFTSNFLLKFMANMSYTTAQIQDDDDLDDTFDMIQATLTVTSIELYTTYNSGTRPSKNNSLTHFDVHHPHLNTDST